MIVGRVRRLGQMVGFLGGMVVGIALSAFVLVLYVSLVLRAHEPSESSMLPRVSSGRRLADT